MTTSSGLGGRFKLAKDTFPQRDIVSIAGEVGVGKTHFTCTARAPILLINIDLGTEGVVEKFRKEGKEIYEQRYIWEPGKDATEAQIQQMAVDIRNKVEADYFYAISNGIASVAIDNESRLWQIYRYAAFGGPNSKSIRDYDELNLRFETLIHRAKGCDINLFMIQAMKNKWGQTGPVNQNTGNRAMQVSGREVWGYEHLPSAVQTQLTFTHDPNDVVDPYKITVGKCRLNPELQFTTLPRVTFPELGTFLVPGSEVEDWL